jgi:hypothetical protein
MHFSVRVGLRLRFFRPQDLCQGPSSKARGRGAGFGPGQRAGSGELKCSGIRMAHNTELTLPAREVVAPGARVICHGSHCTRSSVRRPWRRWPKPPCRHPCASALLGSWCCRASGGACHPPSSVCWSVMGESSARRARRVVRRGAVHQVSKVERRWSGSTTK